MELLTCVVLLTSIITGGVSANSLCSFASCPRRSLELNETDSPVILPCDNSTLVNTIGTPVIGNYSYCYNGTLLVNQSSNYYTLNFDFTFHRGSICCYDHDRDACEVCYNLNVNYAPRNQTFLIGPRAILGLPYTAMCDSVGNPPPVCQWTRYGLFPVINGDTPNFNYDYDGSGSGSGSGAYVVPMYPQVTFPILNITEDAVFTNNGCAIHFDRLERMHNGNYFCNATNFLGTGYASLPSISLSECESRSASNEVRFIGPSFRSAAINDSVMLTCVVSPASFVTRLQFIYNNTTYRDNGKSYPDVGITVDSSYHIENCSLQSTLTIKRFSRQFIGEYSCVATIGQNLPGDDAVVFLTADTDLSTVEAATSAENTGIIVGTTLAIFVILMLLLVSFVVLRVTTRNWYSSNILKFPPPPCSPGLYRFDVFVSHAHDTEDFAERMLKKGLIDKGYSVKTPGDFVVGYTDAENIIDAYNISRYIVILFSEAFDHNGEQLLYAYNKLDMTRTNCLIPVMCGATVAEKLRHVTYADYEKDDVVARVIQTIGPPVCKA